MDWQGADNLLLRGGDVVTSSGRRSADVHIRDGVIVAVGADLAAGDATVLDVRGLHVLPGFVDIHVHLRDPGAPDSEVLASGLEAAARAGVHHVFCMANTDPVNDDPAITADLVARARALSPLHLHPVAAVTRGLSGSALTDFAGHKAAGAGGLSNDGLPVEDPATLAAALEKAADVGLPILVHAEDRDLARGGALDARVAARFGVRGIPVKAEDAATARDVGVAARIGARLHVCHISTAGAVDIVRRARDAGASVTAEATPHHIALSFEDIREGDTDFKMNPPLRSREDVQALVEGLLDGTVSAIATDHAPHAPARKAVSMDAAPFGVIGLETSFAVAYTALVASGRLSLERLVPLFVDGPAAVAGIEAPAIAPGSPASLNLVDLRAEWRVDPAGFASRSRNCPFRGRRLKGAVVGLVEGRRLARWPLGERQRSADS